MVLTRAYLKFIVMKLRFLLIVLYFLIISCSSKRECYAIIGKTLDNDYSKDCDSTIITKNTTIFNKDFFKYYKNSKLKKMNNDFPSYHPYITWINEKKWILDDDDIKFMLGEKSKKINLNLNKLKSKKVILSSNLSVYNNIVEKNKNYTQQIINCNFFYELSTPIFNKKKIKQLL